MQGPSSRVLSVRVQLRRVPVLQPWGQGLGGSGFQGIVSQYPGSQVLILDCAVQVDTVYQKVLCSSCLFLLLRHGIQKTKEDILHKWDFILFYSRNNFCIMNKIELVWFYLLHRNSFFLSKNVIFLHLKIFLSCYSWKFLKNIE